MKKFLYCILAAVLILSTFAGCGQQNTPPTESTGAHQTESTDKNQTESTAAEQTESTEAKPQEVKSMNILMVGNSFCYYFCDELYGMLKSVGIEANIYNAYYSGCLLKQHWEWWRNGESRYELISHNANGRRSKNNVSLEYCLAQGDWDVITLQEGSSTMRTGDPAEELAKSAQYRQELYGLFAQKHPDAKLYWHQTWAYQVGFDKFNYFVNGAEQAAYHERQRTYALGVCTENNVARIPSGDAWKIVRDGDYDNLCARIAMNNGLGDDYHDGDIGGGQYLNACVWFETLTGQSCIGNTFRPDYALSEDMIAKLQNAAHQAVAALD